MDHKIECGDKMRNNCFSFVLILTSIFICIAADSTSSFTQVDLIEQGLEDLKWREDEVQCRQDTLHVLNNVKNHTLWAVWIWNSMTYPTGTFYGSRYSLGNYDQCLKAPSVTGDPKILTQYCLVDVKLTSEEVKKRGKINVYAATDEFLKIKSKTGRKYNLLSWGTCLPVSCNHHAVTKILKVLYSVNPMASADPEIVVDNCQVAGEKTVYSTAFYVFMTVMASLIVVAVASTIYLQYTVEDTRLTRVAYSFSLLRNWSSFTRTTGEEIAFLNFIKTVHIVVITCIHVYPFLYAGAVGNGMDYDYYIAKEANIPYNLILHVDLAALENFLVISGLLIMKNLMDKKPNLIIFLLQRYIRLIGSFTFLVFYTIAVSKYTGDGPLWNKLVGKEQKACEDNWMWSLLMVNNYINNENICQLVSWYAQSDYQLAIMATLLYGIWHRSKRAGKIATTLIVFLAIIFPGVVTYWKRIPGIMLYDVEHFQDFRTNVVYLNTYMKGHHRAGPYLLGMAMGYILTIYNPAKHRGVISRRWSYIGFVIAGILGLRVWTSAAAWCLGEYSAWNSAIYAAFNGNIWALTTCLSIVIAEYGDIPKLRSIFAWPGFVICSRLAYGIYITHSLILQRNIFSQRQPMQFDIFALIITGLGVLLASSIFAVLLWLFVEAPLSNLTNLILAPRKKVVANGMKHEHNKNGHTMIPELKNGKHL